MSVIIPIRAADRRETPRITFPFGGACSSFSGQRTVRISDLSMCGCFVEALEAPAPGERVRVEIDVPGWGRLEVTGDVVYVTPRLGFGVRFVDVPPTVHAALQAIVGALLPKEHVQV